MWLLNKISAKNICAFKELDYELNSKVTTLVFGNNMDNDSQGSNGSGKSALLECISIGLTGETLRKIKMEEIINDAEEAAYVGITLCNDSTNETLLIERYIERGEVQRIECSSISASEERTDIVQSSVAEYNKFILNQIGLTKDDIFANYILSKHKFKSFLSSSDKDRKDIINRFSNGVMVDAGIEKLESDIVPINEKLTHVQMQVANINGSISAIDEQIANMLNEDSEKEKSKAKRIEELNGWIAEKRKSVRSSLAEIDKCNSRIAELNELDDKTGNLENDALPTDEAYSALACMSNEYHLGTLSDWSLKTSKIKEDLEACKHKSIEFKENIQAISDELEDAMRSHASLVTMDAKNEKAHPDIIKGLDEQIDNINCEIAKIKKRFDDRKVKGRALNAEIATLSNKIAGIIVCPKCKYEFVLEAGVDITATEQAIDDKLNDVKQLENDNTKDQNRIVNLESARGDIQDDKLLKLQERSQMQKKIYNSQQNVNRIDGLLTELENKQSELTSRIGKLNEQINNIQTAMFDEMYKFIDDEINAVNANILLFTNQTNVDNGSISVFKKSIEELNAVDDGSVILSFKESRGKYEKQLSNALAEQDSIELKLNKYKEQEARFVEFKTHLANTKIDSLSHITNEFLKAIGSDIRIKFSGYTILKSGKVRDKISISLIRDGIDCGSFDKFSEGERARVNLANILAMHTLTNTNCDEGKGLDLLVLDEILEAADEAGLSNIFDALNQLKITALVVSHGQVAENYPYQTIVSKLNGISFINEKG